MKRKTTLLALVATLTALSGCTSQPVQMDPLGYRFGYKVAESPRSLSHVQVFDSEESTYVMLPRGVVVNSAFTADRGEQKSVVVGYESPYWILPSVASRWVLRTTEGTVIIARDGSSAVDVPDRSRASQASAPEPLTPTEPLPLPEVASAQKPDPAQPVPGTAQVRGALGPRPVAMQSPSPSPSSTDKASGGDYERLRERLTAIEEQLSATESFLSEAVHQAPPLSTEVEKEEPWIVPFAYGSTRLDALAETQLRRILAHIGPSDPVAIWGVTTTTGGKDVNDRVARQRAGAVREWLIQHDVAPERVRIAGRDEKRNGLWAEVVIGE